MCLAIPGRVISIERDLNGVCMGRTDFGGIVKKICLDLVPQVSVGDYVLVHVGVALSTIDETEAERTYRALENLNQLSELEEPDDSSGVPR